MIVFSIFLLRFPVGRYTRKIMVTIPARIIILLYLHHSNKKHRYSAAYRCLYHLFPSSRDHKKTPGANIRELLDFLFYLIVTLFKIPPLCTAVAALTLQFVSLLYLKLIVFVAIFAMLDVTILVFFPMVNFAAPEPLPMYPE